MRNEVHRGGMVELVWPTCHIVVQFSLVSAPRQHTKAISLNQPSGEGWLPRGSVVKNLPANAGDTGDKGSVSELGRAPEGGNGNLLQYSCLENPMETRACGLQSMGSQKSQHD